MMCNINNKGLILVISSPSGAGKTTICKKLIEEVDGINLSVSVTTRKKRKEEIEGKHYFFKNEYDFVIINTKIKLAVEQIKSILFSERLRRHRQISLKKTLDKLL